MTEADDARPSISSSRAYKLEDQHWYTPIPSMEERGGEALEEAPVDVVLLTAVPFERDAVLRLLIPLPNHPTIIRTSNSKETYYLGQFGSYKAVVTMCEMGMTGRGSSILATNEAILNWMPKAIIMVGLAYGRGPEKQNIADVLVSSQVINCGPKRIENKKIVYRGPRVEPGQTLLNNFRNVIGWQFERPDGSQCRYHIGPLLSEEHLIDDSQHKKGLFKEFSDAVGGEMEGAGVSAAADRQGVEWIIVKSICDWADGWKTKEHQPLAAAAAASLVHFVLSGSTALPARGIGIHKTVRAQSNLERTGKGGERHNGRSTSDKSTTTQRGRAASDGRTQAGRDDLSAIREGCYGLTKRIATVLTNNRAVIPRHSFRSQFNDFLSSPFRYCFVLGPSGVGKSVTMAAEAVRIFDTDWSSLLMIANNFSIEAAYGSICEEVRWRCSGNTFRQLIKTVISAEGDGSEGLVIFIDAIDDANPDRITTELSRLHETIGDLPPERLKIVVSCRDRSWEDLKNRPGIPIYQQAAPFGITGTSSYVSVELTDFSPTELNSALEEIGAEDLLIAGRARRQDDYHIQTLRELLTHPARFGDYTNLRSSADPSVMQNLTWSSLIERSLEQSLKKPARRCGALPESLREHLILLASNAWKAKASGFSLDTNMIEANHPELFAKDLGADLSPFEALLEAGILVETKTSPGHSTVAFRVTDVGSYYLSIEFERRLADRPIGEFREVIEVWVREAWNYTPSIDAILAWIDRLAERPFDPRLLDLIDSIINAHFFDRELIFGLVRPVVIASIFELVKHKDLKDFYAYREAARGIRYSSDALRVIRDHLKDPNPQVRQLATELVGIHADIESAEALLSNFADDDEYVRGEVYGAFRRIGIPALEKLIEVASNPSSGSELRAHCLGALRGIGYRDERISALIRSCLSNAESGNPELVRSAFLVAAHLRDKGHTEAAIMALRHNNLDIVHAAAKYLTEVPDAKAFDALVEALRPQWLPSGEMTKRYWVPRQLVAALFRTEPQKAEPIALSIMDQAFRHAGEFYPIEGIWLGQKLIGPTLFARMLEELAAQLQESRKPNLVTQAAETVGGAWQPDILNALIASAESLTTRSIDLAPLLVADIAEGIEIGEGFRVADHLSWIADLRTAVKSRSTNVILEATKLLSRVKSGNLKELCNYIWISGDERAEQSLLTRMEHSMSEEDMAWYEKSNLSRALGTCGTKRSWGAIQGVMETEDKILAHFDQEALYPLVLRKVIRPSDLTAVVRDASYRGAGRTLCLIALALLSASRHKKVFEKAAGYSDCELLQRHGARMLGFTRDSSVVTTLIQLVRVSTSELVKSEAAEALGRLGARQAVHDLERALEKQPASGFIRALANFQEQSSLPLIMDGVQKGPGELYEDYLHALGAFCGFREGREAIETQLSQWSRPAPSFFDHQTPLVTALIRYNPNMLLAQTVWLLDNGCLTTNARAEIARSISSLVKRKQVDKEMLKQTIERLTCDRDVMIRELTIFSLCQAGVKLATSIYSRIMKSARATEWDRACAVYMMSVCAGDVERAESARYGSEFLVRRAGDQAMDTLHRRTELEKHVDEVGSSDGLARLSAYLCLEEQADLFSLAFIHERCKRGSLNFTFLRTLTGEINDRLKKEYKERQDREGKLEETRGTISFD